MFIPQQSCKIILCLFTTLYTFASFSQKDFRDGYIITNENDTIEGKVSHKPFYRGNLLECIFKKGNKTEKFLPDDIKGYGIKDYKFYISGIIESQFVEFLVEGKISLFKNQNEYLVRKGDEIFELDKITDPEIDKNKKKWKGIIIYLTSDCEDLSDAYLSRVGYSEKDLKDLIIKYNECQGVKSKVYKYDGKWFELKVSGSAGVSITKLGVVDIPYLKRYLSKNYSSTDPRIGIGLYLTAPAYTDKFGLEMRFNYSQSSFYSLQTIEGSSIELHDSFIDIETLSIPFTLRYNIINKSYNLFTNVGFNLDYYISSSNSYISEIIAQNEVDRYIGENDFQLYQRRTGLFLGLGFTQSKFLRSGVFLSYTYHPQLDLRQAFRLNLNRFSFSFIIYSK